MILKLHVIYFVDENISPPLRGSRSALRNYLNSISNLVKTTTVASTKEPQDDANGSSNSSVVGIIIGCIAVVIIVILSIAVFVACKHSNQRVFSTNSHHKENGLQDQAKR